MKRQYAKPVLYLAAIIMFAWSGIVSADDTSASIFAWKQWKSIDAAIALRSLDGPEDIREKAEIIADRLDELKREKTRLEKEIDQNQQTIQSLRNQRDILQDLAELQQGGDTQTQQRIHELTERIQQQEQLLKMRRESLRGLVQELERIKRLLADYQQRANSLQRREGGAP